MSATLKTKHDLMKYFAALGTAPGHLFSLRDFNSQVMMNAFAPAERDALQSALGELCAEGVLAAHSPTEYVLTEAGQTTVRSIRSVIPERRAPERASSTGRSLEWLKNESAGALALPAARARPPGDSSFRVTFFEWRGATSKRTQRLVNIDAHDRGAAVKLATASLSAAERNRFAVLRVELNPA